MITGDKHQHSVRNVPEYYRDVASTPLATEFVGTSITTGGKTILHSIHVYGADIERLGSSIHRRYSTTSSSILLIFAL